MKVLVTGASGLLGGAVAAAAGARRATRSARSSAAPPASTAPRTSSGPSLTPAAVRARRRRRRRGVVHLAAKVSFAGRAAEFERSTSTARAACSRGRPRGRCASDWSFVSSPSVAQLRGRRSLGCGAEAADPERARGDYARTKAEAELLALAADSPGCRVVGGAPAHRLGPG